MVNIYSRPDWKVLLTDLLNTMTLGQTFLLLLILGRTVTSEEASSLCALSEDSTRCVCNVMVIHNPIASGQICFLVRVTELELRDGELEVSERDLIFLSHLSTMNKLIFNNVTISILSMKALIPLLTSKLNEIRMISSTLEVSPPFCRPEALPEASTLKSLQLEDVAVDTFLLRPSFQVFHQWFLGSLKSLAVVNSGPVEFECSWAEKVENLSHLDLSGEPISCASLQNITHCSSLSFKHLKSLHLRQSNLTSLLCLCTPLSLTPALTELDVSRNSFSIIHYPHCLQEKPLRVLNLSHSGITEVNSLLSASLEELDLSYNYLQVFSSPPPTLRKLNLSHNRLIRLPSLDNMIHLRELRVDSNRLTVLINETGVTLSKLKQLDSLYAGRNPYQCDSALKDTVTFLDSVDSVTVQDYPEEFLCAAPLDQEGVQVSTLSVGSFVKPTSGTQHHGSPLCLTLFVGLLSHQIYCG